MNIKSIYGLIAAFAIFIAGMAAAGCSDNISKEFEPISSADRTLTINGSTRDTTITVTAGAATRTINVKSNTRWTVRVIDGGGWCTTDIMSGRGDESFMISIMDNTGGSNRHCTVEISAVDAEGQQDNNQSLVKTITIVQNESNVSITPSSLEAFPATEGNKTFEIKANTGWTLEISYENENTPHFLSITPGMNMEQVGEDKYSGSEDARFSVHIASNGSDASRVGYLTLQAEGSLFPYTLEIRQNKSEYTFDVSADTRTVPSQGGSVNFTVLSQSAWTVSTSDKGVTFEPASGDGNGLPVTTVATITPNKTDTVRTIKIHFNPTNSSYVPQTFIITQQPFNLTFMPSPGTLPGVVHEEGGTFTFNVNSMFDWRIASTVDWLSVDPNEGRQSTDASTVNVRIDKNGVERQREAVITVTPLPTDFYPGVRIHPDSVGVMPFTVNVLQYGGQEPAVSAPWLRYEAEQKQLTLSFNYYSPYKEVSGAGLKWRKVGDTVWNDQNVSVTNPATGTLTVTLDGLEAVTKYEAYGYVVAEGKEYPGTLTGEFTTAGRFPGSGDNPTPTR